MRLLARWAEQRMYRAPLLCRAAGTENGFWWGYTTSAQGSRVNTTKNREQAPIISSNSLISLDWYKTEVTV